MLPFAARMYSLRAAAPADCFGFWMSTPYCEIQNEIQNVEMYMWRTT